MRWLLALAVLLAASACAPQPRTGAERAAESADDLDRAIGRYGDPTGDASATRDALRQQARTPPGAATRGAKPAADILMPGGGVEPPGSPVFAPQPAKPQTLNLLR